MKKSGKAPYINASDRNAAIESLSGKNRYRNEAVLLFSHFLGLRSKEIASLKIRDVFDSRSGALREVIRLVAAYTKGGKYREVFLMDQETKSTITRYIINERAGHSPDDPLFLSQKGGAFSANTMQRMIANLYKNAGIKGSSHSGRRSFATNLINQNVDIYSVQQLLGHSSIQTTQEYFTSNPDRLKNQVLKLSQ